MCGIAGIVSHRPIEAGEIAALGAMNNRLRHRGPDGEGHFTAANVALAMRRLSIIDLAGGWQPLYNEDRSLVIVANGEIYNYVELRKQLEERGHRLTTSGDIETILHLYEEHGLDCVQYLRGMFAFALWDSRRRRLVLARDRMGEKPLYLYESDRGLVFASEMKALIASGLVPFELDPNAIDLYFHYQYVPEPMTPLKGVRKLDAAHLLTVDTDPWRVEERCYWRMEDAPPIDGDPATLIREQLETVSELVIRSDVPVGVALSGGLDSSAIAALAQKKYPGTMHAFSVGYPGAPENDERADARRLANCLGMPFHDVELDTASMVEFFPELVLMRDDPIADVSGYGYYAVSKLAREHGVPVLLQGQGGDELFWGYPWLAEAARESKRKYALRDQRALAALPHYLGISLPRGGSRYEFAQWALTFAGLRPGWQSFRRDRASEAEQFVFYDLVSDFAIAKETTRNVYSKLFCEQLNGSRVGELFTFAHPWPNVDVTVTRLICDTYLRENGVTQGDRLSMASSIELRLPLLDHRFVETVIGLRKTQSDVSRPPKDWLKASLSGLLPDWVMKRRKRGFTPPVTEWHNALSVAYGGSLSDGYLSQSNVFSQEGARLLATGSLPDATFSFKAIVLEQWCRQISLEATYGE
jgi:asparagine synthase (glutamine-hydrolysing)